jgi:hypothetical protein
MDFKPKWETTMLSNRISSRMAVGLFLILLSNPAFGQGLRGLQLFAPPEVSTMGAAPKANEGFFFVYDGLYWSISAPRITQLGNQAQSPRDVWYGPLDSDMVRQINTMDTGVLSAKFEPGQRFEIGRVQDHNGWVVGVTQLQQQAQLFSEQNVQMVVNDPPFGAGPQRYLDGVVGVIPNPTPPPLTLDVIRPLPLVWDTLSGHNFTKYWSVEWMYIFRTHQFHDGGYCEFFIGPRYFELDDNFFVNATGGILADSFWSHNAENHVIAGQVGARWFRKVGRWMLSTEGRFWAGLDCQNFSQDGVLGSLLPAAGGVHPNFTPLLMSPTAFFHTEFKREFNPGVELRVEARYQLTQMISLRAGWTGMWTDRVARASSTIDYTMPDFGILTERNREHVFINGLVIGLDINR